MDTESVKEQIEEYLLDSLRGSGKAMSEALNIQDDDLDEFKKLVNDIIVEIKWKYEYPWQQMPENWIDVFGHVTDDGQLGLVKSICLLERTIDSFKELVAKQIDSGRW